jgi:hypothetical protein
MAYTFELTLVDSSNPVITRTFDVPSWFTFKELHWCIQYGMGPWDHTHLHQFEFKRPGPRSRLSFDAVLEIHPESSLADRDQYANIPWMPRMNRCPAVSEIKTKLKDIYDSDSGQSIRNTVLDSTGQVLPLVYIYDMGVRF